MQITAQKQVKRKLTFYMAVSLIIIFGLISLVLSPIYTSLIINSVYQYTLLPDAVYLTIQLLNLVAFSVSFSLIIFSIYRFKLSGSYSLIVLYACFALIKYCINLLVSFLMFKTFDTDELWGMITGFIIEFAVVFLVAFISDISLEKAKKDRDIQIKASALLKSDKPKRSDVFSLERFFDFSSPIQKVALKVGIVMATLKIVSRLYYDLSTYGLIPVDLTDLLWMIMYYTSDIVCGLIVYVISILALRLIKKRLSPIEA